MRPPILQHAHANGQRRRDLHAIVLAGGAGRRLQSLIHCLFGSPIPKQFCRFGSDHSLVVETIERMARLVPSSHATVVVDQRDGARAAAELHGQAGLTLVEQPCDRGTAAGVLLPLLDVLRRAPDATVVVLPSDHGVTRPDLFRATVAAATIAVRDRQDEVVLIGAEPDAPRVDQEWIVRTHRPEPDGVPDPVVRLVERPDAETAEHLFRTRRGVWNTGAVVARGMSLLRLLQRHLPDLTRELAQIVAHDGVAGARDGYAALVAADFTASVIGRARSLAVVSLPREAEWTDLDTEPRVVAWLRRLEERSITESARPFAFDLAAVKRLLWWRRRADRGAPANPVATERAPGPLVRACAWHENVTGPNVTHMICPACFERVAAGIAAAARRNAPTYPQPAALVAKSRRPRRRSS